MYLVVEDSGQIIDVKEDANTNKNTTRVAFNGVNIEKITEQVLRMFDWAE